VSTCFCEIGHASEGKATLHGVVFDIFGGASAASALRLSFPIIAG
jgi:hypothetical protein